MIALLVTLLSAHAEEAVSHDVTTYGLVHRPEGRSKIEVRREVPYGETSGQKLSLDLYLPKKRPRGERLPVVLFLDGIGGPLREWAIYRTWMETVASHGFAVAMGGSDPAAVGDSLEQLLAY